MSVEKEGYGPTRYPESDLSIATAGLGALLVDDDTGLRASFGWSRASTDAAVHQQRPYWGPALARHLS